MQFACIGLEFVPDFVPHPAKTGENFLLGAGRFGGIVERPVMSLHLAGENGADGIRIATDGDHGVDRLVEKFLQVFRAMAGNVNARLGHDLDGPRMNITGRIRSGALDVYQFAGRGAQKALGHVAAAGVAGAKDENNWFHFVGDDVKSLISS